MPCASVSEKPTRVNAENLYGGLRLVGAPRRTGERPILVSPSRCAFRHDLKPFRRLPGAVDERGETLMKRRMVLVCALLAALTLGGPIAAQAAEGGVSLDQYKATVTQEVYRDLAAKGFDIVTVSNLATGEVEIDLVLTKAQAQALRKQDVGVQLRKNKFGTSAREFAAAGGERLHCLARLRQRKRDSRAALRHRAPEPAAGEARRPRPHAPGARDHRAQADAGRTRPAGRQPAGGSLLLDAARAGVDLDGGEPPPAHPLRRALARERQGDQGPAQGERVLVRARRQPGRLPVHVPERGHAPLAQEPARQERQRDDRGRRRRRPEPELSRALQLRRGGIL